MKKILLTSLFLFTIMATIGSAQNEVIEVGNFLVNSSLNLLLDCSFNNTNCASSALCNITVQYPNNSLMINSQPMGTTFYPKFNRTITDTTVFGRYDGTQTCCQSGLCGQQDFYYLITPSGEDTPGDNFLILIYIGFTIICVLLFYTLIMTVAKIATVSETIYGIAFTWSVYFVLLILYWMINHYSTSSFLRNNIGLFVTITGFTHIILPLISFVISIFARSTQKARLLTIPELMGRNYYG